MRFTYSLHRAFMVRHFERAWREQRTEARSAEEFFGFAAHDVEAMHFHLEGVGVGDWFRLRDGRVFCSSARLAPRDYRLYDMAVQ